MVPNLLSKGATSIADTLIEADENFASLDSRLVNVTSAPFNVRGDGTDEKVGILAAAAYAQAIRGTLHFPPPAPGSFYGCGAPIVFDAPVSITGDSTYGVTLMGVDLGVGQYVIDFNCLAGSNVELISIKGLTIRSNNGLASALRLRNTSFVTVSECRFYNVTNGCVFEGTRCFSNTFNSVDSVSISGAAIAWGAGFVGGGHFVFNSCTFTGNYGVNFPSTAVADALSFNSCNFEQCVSASMLINGTVGGLTVSCPRTEGCNSYDFIFRPSLVAEFIGGISITGGVFGASDAGAVNRIRIGGDLGKVRGFSITGNSVTHGADTFSGSLVELNGDGESGAVFGNYLRGTTCTAVSAPRNGVVIFGNENLSGKLPEYWGLGFTVWGSAVLTATGMTTAPTGIAKYAVANGVATLDFPFITGASNATTFTLTGLPAALRPLTDKDVLCRVADNGGSDVLGFARIKTTGVIELYAAIAGTAFTAAGVKRIDTCSVCYGLN